MFASILRRIIWVIGIFTICLGYMLLCAIHRTRGRGRGGVFIRLPQKVSPNELKKKKNLIFITILFFWGGGGGVLLFSQVLE